MNFALLLVVAVVVASSSLAVASSPAPPSYALPFHIVQTDSIIPEALTTRKTIFANSAGTKALQTFDNIGFNNSKTWYSALVRNDLMKVYNFWPVQGEISCFHFSLPTGKPYPIEPPLLQGLQFAGDVLMGANTTAHKWQLPYDYGGRSGPNSIQGAFSDAKTGDYIGAQNHMTMAVSSNVNVFKTGSACPEPDDSVFKVPAECETPGAEHILLPDPVSSEEDDHRRLFFSAAATAPAEEYAKFLRVKGRLVPARSMPFVKAVARENDVSLQEAWNHIALLPNLADLQDFKSIKINKNKKRTEINLSSKQVDNSIYASPVRSQGAACGCCWSCSTAAAAEIFWNKKDGLVNKDTSFIGFNRSLSFQSIIDCVHGSVKGSKLGISCKGCAGGNPYKAIEVISSMGIAREVDVPFRASSGSCPMLQNPNPLSSNLVFPFKGVRLAQNNVTAIEEAVEKNGAVIAIMLVLGDFITYRGGVYDNPKCVPGLSHAVAIVGFGVDKKTQKPFWKVKNSFGNQWGVGGYFKIARGVNMCGIEDFGIIPEPS